MTTASSTDADHLLESIWREQIPLAAVIDLSVSGYADERLTTSAPLAPNVNLHGTAFAGSLYSICALTGWGHVWRLGRDAGVAGDLVLSRSDIDFLRPVAETIVCRSSIGAQERESFVSALLRGQSARCRVECEIRAGGKPAVRFTGRYHMRPADCAGPAG